MSALRDPDTGLEVVVRRSARRRRTVSAHREGDQIVVLLPARLGAAEERRWVDEMLARLHAAEAKRRPSDADLLSRAEELSRRYLRGRAQPASVAWSERQRGRWGSCTPSDRSIRLSARLQGVPSWVLDYVIVHELAHLLVPGHTQDFWRLVANYPRAERARGFLEGIAHAEGTPEPTGDEGSDDD
ncbi:MAG: M48 metallopeptidase family protein [Actinomycetes bacterium]